MFEEEAIGFIKRELLVCSDTMKDYVSALGLNT